MHLRQIEVEPLHAADRRAVVPAEPRGELDPFEAGDGWAPAYQVAVGLRAKVTDNLSLFTEFKHQDVIAPATVGDLFDNDSSVGIAKANNAVVAGLRFNY